jgi:gliding motility-associated protein GldL
MSSVIHSKTFKYAKNMILGVGASVVMVGALFKILHWAGADLMLMVGMFTEAFIFALLGILPPEPDYYWDKVYPGLDEYPDHEHKKKTKALGAGKGTISQQLDKMLEDAKVETQLIERLGTNLQRFGENLEKMNQVADAGAATNEYSSRAKEAAAALSEMKDAYSEATAAVNELSKVSQDTKGYHEQVQLVSKNLAALNAVYELELQDTNNHLKAMNKFYGSLTTAMDNMHASVDDAIKYREEIGHLSRNLSDLNKVYGNMLSAMTVRG